MNYNRNNGWYYINGNNINNTLIAAHTYDTFGKSVAEYGFSQYRCIHISQILT